MRRRIPAGLLDAGLAALASFAVGLYAAWVWQDDLGTLGVYALFMAAFGLATAVGSQAIFIPAEKATLELATPERVALLPRTIRRGLPLAIAAGAVMLAPSLIARAQGTEWAAIAPLVLTAGAASIVSPVQDHARRVLHLAGISWSAAFVSIVQVSVAVVTVATLHAFSLDPAWIPFGALATANVTSLTAAILMARRRRAAVGPADPDRLAAATAMLGYGSLLRSGRWLAPTGIMSTGNNLVVAAIVSSLVGQEALGFAEAARTIGQPILVLAFGLRSVLGPQSMEAAKQRSRPDARRVASMFYKLTLILGVAYLAVAGFAWPFNPFAHIVERAYTIGGLVATAIVANALNGLAFPGRLELIGGDRERSLFTSEVIANAAQLVVAAAVALAAGSSTRSGAFAVAIAFAALGAARLPLYRMHLDSLYRPAAAAEVPAT